ncbi:hypothetical protein J6590_026712 [Homalodisca vitripennis]|nr:hypothetical protein J6590_026712 [Homalodisca vitripennis]
MRYVKCLQRRQYDSPGDYGEMISLLGNMCKWDFQRMAQICRNCKNTLGGVITPAPSPLDLPRADLIRKNKQAAIAIVPANQSKRRINSYIPTVNRTENCDNSSLRRDSRN